jgi:cell division protein FtsB
MHKSATDSSTRRFPSPLPPPKRERQWTGKVLCFAACVLAVNALVGERGLSETLRAQREFQAAVADVSKLQYENALLAETVRQLQQDAPAIESVARAELGLIKPGEILVVVKPVAAAPSPALTRTATDGARP